MQDFNSDLTQPLLSQDRPVFGGRYILQALLGVGGMGAVWRAREVSLRREVALKFLPPSIARDDAAREDLKKEVLLSQELSHPHIIRVHNFEEDQILAAIAMELVDGQPLNTLKVERPHSVFSPSELMPWIEQLCAALAYAHGLHIVHRDLKPGNIMISAKAQVKVLDFGIAASVSEATTRTVPQAAFGQGGTLAYMSPQQARGDKPTAADDIYSLGATLYECLTGKPPFFRGEVYAQVLEVPPPSLNRRRAELDPPLPPLPAYWEETILACLAKKREERPAGADVLAGLLLRSDKTVPITPAPAPPASAGKASPRAAEQLPPPIPETAKPLVAPTSGRSWERLALALSTRVDIYRDTFGLNGTLKQRFIGVVGTLALLGFVEVWIIDWSGAFGPGGWFNRGSGLFRVFDGWARHVFTFWNFEKTALTFFAIFVASQVLLALAIKRMIGFGRISITSQPEGAMVQTLYGKKLGRTPLLLRLVIPGQYRFRIIFNQNQQEDLSGVLPKNQTLKLSASSPAKQKT